MQYFDLLLICAIFPRHQKKKAADRLPPPDWSRTVSQKDLPHTAILDTSKPTPADKFPPISPATKITS
jgi:hypothetical protein